MHTHENKIGYVPIRYYNTDKPKVCEAPKHIGLNLPAFGVLVIQGASYPDGLVQMVCEECWLHFDNDMNHPEWNLIRDETSGETS